MNTVYKYPLQLVPEQTIEVPQRFKALTAQMQGEQLCVWAAVQSEYATINLRVYIYGTGVEVPPNQPMVYIGTVQQGGFVWHVFHEMI